MQKLMDNNGNIIAKARSFTYLESEKGWDSSDREFREDRNKDLYVLEDVAPQPNLAEWLIDVGPFMDRFGGATKHAILRSVDLDVQAIVKDMLARKYIDLKRPDVAYALSVIGSIIPAVTPALQTAILTIPVTTEENRALRMQFFR